MSHTPPGETRGRVLRFVRERLLAGRPPTVREVQEAFGFRAVESARAHLTALVESGFLDREPGQARGWRLPSNGTQAPVLVPILGHVQAGALTTALEEPEGEVAVQSRGPAGELFALHVRGDSMRGAGILDGDLVVVRRQETAEDGRIVVALVGDEATVKRLRIRRHPGPHLDGGPVAAQSRIELHPENPDFPVIVPPPGEARILGRVIEVRRHLDTESGAPWDSAFPGVAQVAPSEDPESQPSGSERNVHRGNRRRNDGKHRRGDDPASASTDASPRVS
ncbi:MAG: transcriptional repressor LexA [Planctomycetes bacterium]|nr:transcriptional repressor LexA [Planctomycetota bacterium]